MSASIALESDEARADFVQKPSEPLLTAQDTTITWGGCITNRYSGTFSGGDWLMNLTVNVLGTVNGYDWFDIEPELIHEVTDKHRGLVQCPCTLQVLTPFLRSGTNATNLSSAVCLKIWSRPRSFGDGLKTRIVSSLSRVIKRNANPVSVSEGDSVKALYSSRAG